MPGRRHNTFIEQLCQANPAVKTTGFRRSVAKYLEEEYDLAAGDQLGWLSIIPDAYEVSHGLITAYEVEDTHRVSESKLDLYTRLWYGLQQLELCDFRLVVLDIRGGRWEPDLARRHAGL